MPRKSEEELERVIVRLFKEDAEWLRSFYGALGYNLPVRLLVRKHRTAVERRSSSKRGKSSEEFTLPEEILE